MKLAIRHVSLATGLLLLLTVTAVITAARPTLRSREKAAWSHALVLAEASKDETKYWKQSPVLYTSSGKLLGATSRPGCGDQPKTICLARVCGETELFYIIDAKDSAQPGSLTIIFLLPTEDQYLDTLLVHEFLHTIWWYRVHQIDGFYIANSDSEIWVQSLINTTCPTL